MRSLGVRIAIVIAAVLFFLTLGAVYIIDRQLSRAVYTENLTHAEAHARTFLASLNTLMLNGQGMLVRQWLDSVRAVEPGNDINVLRRDGTEAFTDLKTLQAVNDYLHDRRFSRQPLSAHQSRVTRQQHGDDAGARRALARALQGETVLDQSFPGFITIYLPIPNDKTCQACHGYDPMPLRGVFSYRFATATGRHELAGLQHSVWGMAAILLVLMGLSLWWALRFSVVRPVSRLRDAMLLAGEESRGRLLPVTRGDELGQVSRVYSQMRDQLQRTESRIQAVMDNVADAIITIDQRGIIESVNPAVTVLFGYTAEEVLGKNISLLMPEPYHSKDQAEIEAYLATDCSVLLGGRREFEGRRKDGAIFPIDIIVSEMMTGTLRHFIGVVRDITERKEQLKALEYQALHDDLTGLPNRALLADRLQQAIRSARREQRSLALLLMDLDHFKEINDTLGHHNGDVILQQVAQRMQQLIRSSDTVARLGGDEFAILLPAADEQHASGITDKIIQSVEQPFTLEGQTFVLGASIGIALFPEHGDDGNTLLQRADVAMYFAKRDHLGFAIYDIKQNPHRVEYLSLKGELREAITNRQLALNYQPVIDIQSGRVSGVEALVRWHHPERGLLMPDEFIPLAEQTGLIRKLTLWVLEEAARQSQAWIDLGLELRVAVNLSVYNLYDSRFPEQIARIIGAINAQNACLRLEITETAIMSGPSNALEILNRLSAQGVRIAIDDFGTGYSSLAYLKQLPVDELKIDKSFVSGMTVDDNDAVIVRSTIDLAHNIGLRVVAEGVEDESTFHLLAGLHCDAAQGYYMGYPMTVERLLVWLRESPWGSDREVH